MRRVNAELRRELLYTKNYCSELASLSIKYRESLNKLSQKRYLSSKDLGEIYRAMIFIKTHFNSNAGILADAILEKTGPREIP